MGGGELTLHHLGEEVAPAVRGQDANAVDTGSGHAPAGNTHAERKTQRHSNGVGAVEGSKVVPQLEPLAHLRKPRRL